VLVVGRNDMYLFRWLGRGPLVKGHLGRRPLCMTKSSLGKRFCRTSVVVCVDYVLYNLILFIVFNATFNNISVISWRSVLLVEETGVSGENQLYNLSSSVIINMSYLQCPDNGDVIVIILGSILSRSEVIHLISIPRFCELNG